MFVCLFGDAPSGPDAIRVRYAEVGIPGSHRSGPASAHRHGRGGVAGARDGDARGARRNRTAEASATNRQPIACVLQRHAACSTRRAPNRRCQVVCCMFSVARYLMHVILRTLSVARCLLQADAHSSAATLPRACAGERTAAAHAAGKRAAADNTHRCARQRATHAGNVAPDDVQRTTHNMARGLSGNEDLVRSVVCIPLAAAAAAAAARQQQHGSNGTSA